MMRHLPARLVAAVVLTAAAGVGTGLLAGPAPASAATCPSSSGVSVVLDFGALGGGVQTACDAGGASRNAAAMFTSVGYALTYVQRFPGFICRINGVPADDPCVNTPAADAYWGLFWSDGTSGDWVYASTAAGSLRVPAGGYVGLAWQSGGQREPGVPATVRPAPTPTAKPSSKPSSKPTPSPKPPPAPTPSADPSSKPSAAPSRTPSASASRTPAPKKSPTKSPGTAPSTAAPPTAASPSPAPSSPAPSAPAPSSPSLSPTSARTDDDSPAASAVPTGLVLGVLVALLVGGAATIAVRRRGSPR